MANLEERRTKDQTRVDDLTPKLLTDEYKRSSLYRSLVDARDDAAVRVDRYTDQIDRLRQWIEEHRERVAQSRKVLGEAPLPPAETANYPSQLTPGEDQRDNGPPKPNWRKSGRKFWNATEGVHPAINRVVMKDDGGGKYRGRVFAKNYSWIADFPGIRWNSMGNHLDGKRWDAAVVTPEQYGAIKANGNTKEL